MVTYYTTFSLVAFMFGLIYKVMPRKCVLAADVWLGAVLAGLYSPQYPLRNSVRCRTCNVVWAGYHQK